MSFYFSQVDIFNGLNNDILAREGLVALDMKHSVSPGPVTPVMMIMLWWWVIITLCIPRSPRLSRTPASGRAWAGAWPRGRAPSPTSSRTWCTPWLWPAPPRQTQDRWISGVQSAVFCIFHIDPSLQIWKSFHYFSPQSLVFWLGCQKLLKYKMWNIKVPK